jgi:hypothetical protein
MVEIFDALTFDASGLSLTNDGYLVGDAKVARGGNVQQYYGYELGLTGDDANKPFGVYRDPDAVFDSASMLSLAGRPISRNHPLNGIKADNWKALSRGQMGGVIRRDGEFVVAQAAIMDAAAVQEVLGGARSLSAGYTANVVAADGVAPDGTHYQFKQVGPIRFNHVAYLPDNNPRAGSTRIGDQRAADDRGQLALPLNERDTTMALDANLKTVVVDGFSISTTDQGAQAIDRLQKQLTDALKATTDAAAIHTTAIATKDTEIGRLKGQLKTAEDKIPTPAQLDALVAGRVAVITAAKALDKDVKTDGISDSDIRKAVVTKVMGDAAVKDASDATITGMFMALTKDATAAGSDPLRDAIRTQQPNPDADKQVTDARDQMIKDMQSAYLPKSA